MWATVGRIGLEVINLFLHIVLLSHLKIYGLEVEHTCDTYAVNCSIPANIAIDQKSKFILAELIKLNEDLHEVDEKIMWAEVFNPEYSYNDFKLFYKRK